MRVAIVDGAREKDLANWKSDESYWIEDGGKLNIVYKWRCAACGNREREQTNFCSYCGKRMKKDYEVKGKDGAR